MTTQPYTTVLKAARDVSVGDVLRVTDHKLEAVYETVLDIRPAGLYVAFVTDSDYVFRHPDELVTVRYEEEES